ncbi:flagellar basal body-associated protein FliL, partial [Proteus mirabilis]
MSNYSNERKSYSLILIILLLVIAIIAAAFGGYSWWALKHAKSGTTGTSQQKVIPAPVFMSLEPFTINLIDEEEHL